MAKRPAKPRASKSRTGEGPEAPAPVDDVPARGEGASADVEAHEDTLRSALDTLEVKHFELDAASLSLGQREAALTEATRALELRERSLADSAAALADREAALAQATAAFDERLKRAENTERALRSRYDALVEREKSVAEREKGMAEREAAMAGREERLSVRERTAIESEREISSRREASTSRERDLLARARALDARDEELAIREAAADEAMSLAHGDDDGFLEGPDMAAPAISAAEAQLSALRQAEERRRAEEERKAAEDRKRLHEEAAQLLGLTRTVPALASLGPRIEKALESLNYTVLTAFYNMAVRQVAEVAKTAPSGDKLESVETALGDKQKALDDAAALITSLKEDFSRYRTRVENEREAFMARANEELLRRILPVADNFDRALSAAAGATNVDAVLSGVRMIQRQFEDVMAHEGLVPIKALGLAFDPRVHDALEKVEMSDVPEDTVVEEVQRGYYLGGKVFRPAMVKVSRAAAGANSAPAASEA